MHIREASKQSGVSVTTIRYYEEVGLLSGVRRTESGYRVFDDHEIRVLIFLRKARELGFSIDACHELLDLLTGSHSTDSEATARAREVSVERLKEIDSQIESLNRMRELVLWHAEQLGASDAECPVAGNLKN